MRVLFTTTPGRGHMHPMVPLAQAFLERGDEVLWAASSELTPSLQEAGFAAERAGRDHAGPPSGGGFAPPGGALPVPGAANNFFVMAFAQMLAKPMFDDLVPIVDRFRPDLIVHEAAEFAGAIAAAKAGVPSITHGVGAVMPAERMAAAGDALAEIWRDNGLVQPAYAGCYTDLYLDIYPPSLQTVAMDHIPQVQPLRPVPFAGSGGTLPQWPEKYSEYPLIYMTFGTAVPAATTPLATVIEGIRDLPVRLLVTIPTGNPEMVGPQPENVRLTGYVSTTAVLNDCAAVVSHAGAGIMLAALDKGLPQLCIPQMSDQFINAANCEMAGAGLVLQGEQVGVSAVHDAVDRLLNDPRPRMAAERMSEEIASMPSPNAVAGLIAARVRG
jgi:UDP:flavonoid glycosyltransferase YjiC (YdhE family)